jgi:hypothetical protein
LPGFISFPLEPNRSGKIAGSGALLVGITALVFVWRRRAPYAVVGWLWFVGTLVPVIGLVQVGPKRMPTATRIFRTSDLRYSSVWGVGALVTRKKINLDLVSASVLLVNGPSCPLWRSNKPRTGVRLRCSTKGLAVTGGSFLFEQNYCQYLLERDRLDEAEQHCRNALTFNRIM